MCCKRILPGVSALIFVAMTLFSCAPRTGYVSISGYAQGGSYIVTLRLPGKGVSGQELKQSIDSVLTIIDTTLSGYNKASTLSKFNAGEAVYPNEHFLQMYRLSKEYYTLTGGVMDVASGPLFDLWGFGFKEGRMPSEEQVDSVRSFCGMSRLVSDAASVMTPEGKLWATSLIEDDSLSQPVLNFNAVAQGYSCDLIAELLRSRGCEDFLINVGGEIFCQGLNPEGHGWTLGVDKPVDGNDVMGAALQAAFSLDGKPYGVVTSGNYRKFYVVDGKKYSHSVDPRTGRPVEHNLLSATVIGPDATVADALATACMVMGLADAKAFIGAHEEFEAYLVYDQDGEFRTWRSRGFPQTK